jgi:hypothetical protein
MATLDAQCGWKISEPLLFAVRTGTSLNPVCPTVPDCVENSYEAVNRPLFALKRLMIK